MFSNTNYKIFAFKKFACRINVKLCRVVDISQVGKTTCAPIPQCGFTEDTGQEPEDKTSYSDTKQFEMFKDTAAFYVGRALTANSFERQEIFQSYRTQHFRRAVPYTSLLLQSSYDIVQPTKQRQNLSGDTSNVKIARTEEHILDEQSDSTEIKPLDAEYGNKRHWELTKLGREQIQNPGPGFEFFVMSYNILAQNLLEDNRYLYGRSPEYVLDWQYRSQMLLREIKALNAEILCLQEVNHKHYEDFLEPALKTLGYQGVYVKRTGDKLDGCATFYKTEKFTLEESVPVEYFKSNCSLLDRDNVGLIVKLRPNKHPYLPEDSLCIANTHLLFNPRRGDVKLAQVMCLLAEVDKVSKTSEDARCQVLVCGDFNATPLSDLFKFIIHGYLKYEGLMTRLISGQSEGQFRGSNRCLSKNFFPSCHKISDQCRHIKPYEKCKNSLRQEDLNHHNCPSISQSSGRLWHHLNLVSTYRHTIERLGHREGEVTTQHSADRCIVDYIFYGVSNRDVHTRRSKHTSTNVQEGKLKLLGRWGLMSAREIRELGDLPNHYHPSDHLPLVVKMLLV